MLKAFYCITTLSLTSTLYPMQQFKKPLFYSIFKRTYNVNQNLTASLARELHKEKQKLEKENEEIKKLKAKLELYENFFKPIEKHFAWKTSDNLYPTQLFVETLIGKLHVNILDLDKKFDKKT